MFYQSGHFVILYHCRQFFSLFLNIWNRAALKMRTELPCNLWVFWINLVWQKWKLLSHSGLWNLQPVTNYLKNEENMWNFFFFFGHITCLWKIIFPPTLLLSLHTASYNNISLLAFLSGSNKSASIQVNKIESKSFTLSSKILFSKVLLGKKEGT